MTGGGVTITLPFPPATLSGHNNGAWYRKSGIVKKHREWARLATMEARPVVSDTGDIRISVTFHAPDNRGDRTNYPNRMKPIFDGIADALGVNDRRFLPSYHFGPNEKPGRVLVTIGGEA